MIDLLKSCWKRKKKTLTNSGKIILYEEASENVPARFSFNLIFAGLAFWELLFSLLLVLHEFKFTVIREREREKEITSSGQFAEYDESQNKLYHLFNLLRLSWSCILRVLFLSVLILLFLIIILYIKGSISRANMANRKPNSRWSLIKSCTQKMEKNKNYHERKLQDACWYISA